MDRFKVKRGPSQPADRPTTKRPLSFTGADEKHKDTLDVFAQFEVSKSLPSSPVLKKKKQSVASLETATPVSPTSMTSGSPFTPGGLTTDSQTSTPVHTDTTATKQDTHPSNIQGEVESDPPAVRQEIQVRVDIEDTSAPTPVIPVIVEPGTEVVEIPADAGEPAQPAKPVVVVVESPAEQPVAEEKEVGVVEVPDKLLEAAEPTAAEDKEEESSTNPAELDESVEPTDKGVESPVKPDELVTLDKEAETTEGPTEPIEPAAEPPIEKETKEEEIETIEKEPEVDDIMAAAEPGISDKAAEQVGMIEEDSKYALDETTEHVAVIQEEVGDRMPSEEPAMSVESAAVTEKEAKEKIDKKPALPAKPAVVTDIETKRKDEKPTKPAKPATDSEKEVEKTEEPLPKYLKDRHFQWDKIREILATAPDSTESSSYSELPPQDVSWMDHSSPAEQLRAFLLVCP